MSTDCTEPRLVAVAEQIEAARLTAVLLAPDWTVAWVSPEVRRAVGTDDPKLLGYGEDWMVFAPTSKVFQSISPRESTIRSALSFLPAVIEDSPDGPEGVIERLSPFVQGNFADIVASVPHTSPPVWTASLKIAPAGMEPAPYGGLGARLRDRDGDVLGIMVLFIPNLPGRLVPYLARGDEDLLDRMSRLAEPGSRQATVLFADMVSSTATSRRLSSAAYFELVRELLTGLDRVVVEHGGVPGGHAGDGGLAFFLAEQLGSSSAAAAATIRAGRAIAELGTKLGSGLDTEVRPGDGLLKVGLHWGQSIYMGQIVTNGRLEVTALGDAVNECARIMECANAGHVLASKNLVELLDAEAEAALGLSASALSYQLIDEIPTATDKARRDAGRISVTTLTRA